MNILYAEKSYRPMPTELTYVPRAPLREYDYYVVLSSDDIVLQMYLEELSNIYEYGAKTAVDRQAGVAIPVQFIDIMNEDISRECDPRCPSLSSWTNPVTIGGVDGNELCSEAEKLSRYSLYPQFITRDFWEELVEAQLFYAPSIYYQYISEPLKSIIDSIIGENGEAIDNDVERYFWRVMKWRTIVDKYLYTGCIDEDRDIYTVIHNSRPEIDLDTYWLNSYQDKKNPLIRLDLSECDRINIIIPLFNLNDLHERAQELGLKLHPALATLATPILHILYKIKIRNTNEQPYVELPLTVTILHDYPSNDKVFPMIVKLGEYVSKLIRYIEDRPPETTFNRLDDEGLRSLGVEVFYTQDHLVYIVGLGLDKLRQGTQRRLRGIDNEYLKRIFMYISGLLQPYVLGDGVCSIILVRDVAKNFLSLLLDYSKRFTRKVYLAYAPEAITIYVKGFVKCLWDIDVKDIIPTIKIPLYFYSLLGEGSESIDQLYRGLQIKYKEDNDNTKSINYYEIFDINYWKCFASSSYISFLEV